MKCLVSTLGFGMAALALPIAACSAQGGLGGSDGIAPTGSGGERRFAVADFDSVGLSTAADVDIRVGSGFSVVATGTPAVLDRLRVRRDGHGIDLGQEKGFHWGSGDRVRFAITMPRIAAASIGGSGSITVDRVQGNRFEGSIGGSGRLTVNGMQVDAAQWNIGGSGDIAASGRARSTSASIGGSGNVRTGALRAETADLTIVGAGNIQASATRTAKVTLVGSGNVTVTGGARCEVSKMGSGKVDCG